MSKIPEEIALQLVDLRKDFRRLRGGMVTAVDGVSLDIRIGEMVVILGPSGCGKTTLLRCIAGLETPSEGRIYTKGTLISSESDHIRMPPEQRGFGMMFQSYAVWPHMTVYQNVSYPLRIRRVPKTEIGARVARILQIVKIPHLANEYPTQLSGGQQQRVALARCLVADPPVILFDEPLSNVDAKVREELRIEIRAMQRRIGFAGVFVTHDQEEATAIADRIVVMQDGKVVQVASPRELYSAPATHFVAGFLGVVNEWKGVLQKEPDGVAGTLTIRTNVGDVKVAAANAPSDIATGDSVLLSVRPEAVAVSTEARQRLGENEWKGEVDEEVFRGPYVDRFVILNGVRVRSRGATDHQMLPGDVVFASIRPEDIRILSDSPTLTSIDPDLALKDDN